MSEKKIIMGFKQLSSQFKLYFNNGNVRDSGGGCFNCINSSTLSSYARDSGGLKALHWNPGYYSDISYNKGIHKNCADKITEFLSNSFWSDCFLQNSFEEITSDGVVKLNIDMPRNAVFLSLITLRALILRSTYVQHLPHNEWNLFSIEELMWLLSFEVNSPTTFYVPSGEAQWVRSLTMTGKQAELFWRGKIQNLPNFKEGALLKDAVGYNKYHLLNALAGDTSQRNVEVQSPPLLAAMKGVTSIKEEILEGMFATQVLKSSVSNSFVFRGKEFPKNTYYLIMMMLLNKHHGVIPLASDAPTCVAAMYTGLISGTIQDVPPVKKSSVPETPEEVTEGVVTEASPEYPE